jgi:O-antigen/teichoic acid export membrane protein
MSDSSRSTTGHSAVKSLSDRAGFLIVANLIKYAVGFVLPMVLVRLLTKSDYGSYQQMILIGTAISGVLTLGLPTSVYYFYHGTEKMPSLVVQTTLMLAASGLVGTLIVFFGADHFASMLNNESAASLLKIYACSLMFMIGSEQCMDLMIAQGRYRAAVMFEIGETFVRVCTLLAPLWLGYGFTGLIVGLVTYSVLRYLGRVGFQLVGSGLDFKGWRRHVFLRDQLEYSVPLALVSLVGWVGGTLNRGMLAAAFNPARYAVYAVGALEIPVDVIFQASVSNVLRASLPPLIRDGNLAEVTRIIREASRKLSIIVLPSFVFLLGYSYEFITVLFTSRYEESVSVFRIILWMMPLNMLVLSSIPHAFGQPKFNLYIVAATTGLLVTLGFILLKTIGFYGPAIAAVSTQYVQVSAYLLVVRKLTKSSVRQLLPLAHILRVLLAAMVALLVSRQVDHLTSWSLANLAICGLIYSVTFFLAAAPIGIFSQQDIQLIKRWLGKILRIQLS